MINYYKFNKFAVLLAGAILVTTCISARAVSEGDSATDGSESAYDGDISTTDLAEGQPITSTENPYGTFSIMGINDGIASDGGSTTGLAFFGGAPFTVTISLDTIASPAGYDLTSITSINGFDNATFFSNQDYTVSFQTTTSGSNFIDPYTVSYNPFTANGGEASSSEVELVDFGLTNVTAVQFAFGSYNDNGLSPVIREIDVNGVAAPEPSSYAMFMAGLGLLAFGLRFSKSRLA